METLTNKVVSYFLHIARILMDFETAAMDAVEAKFTQSRLIGCRISLGTNNNLGGYSSRLD